MTSNPSPVKSDPTEPSSRVEAPKEEKQPFFGGLKAKPKLLHESKNRQFFDSGDYYGGRPTGSKPSFERKV